MNKVLFSPTKTVVMGILNITPDSFSDGGQWMTPAECVDRVRQMLAEGADVIDIGGESTRPGAEPVSKDEELRRVMPIIRAIRAQLGSAVCLSLDTYKAEVAKEGLAAGVDLINDVSGFRFDTAMAQVVADAGCQVILNHIFGQPATMQQSIVDRADVTASVLADMRQTLINAQSAGIETQQIILDPGFGFGKTYEENLTLLKQLPRIVSLGYPVMVGLSRKRTTGLVIQHRTKSVEEPAATERLGSSVAAHVIAAISGASMIRVHDVLTHVQAMAMVDAVKESDV